MNNPTSQHHELYRQGREAMDQKEWSRAIELLLASAGLLPHFKTFELIGECYLNLDEASKSVLYLSAAAGLGNRQSRPYYLLAKALIDIREIDSAKVALDRAIDINPDYSAAKALRESIGC